MLHKVLLYAVVPAIAFFFLSDLKSCSRIVRSSVYINRTAAWGKRENAVMFPDVNPVTKGVIKYSPGKGTSLSRPPGTSCADMFHLLSSLKETEITCYQSPKAKPSGRRVRSFETTSRGLRCISAE
jgi:hypothetical protein